MKKFISTLIITVFCFGSHSENSLTRISIGGYDFITEIADTPIKMQKGLMYRTKISQNEAMLFILNQPQTAVFWMKNMKMPIDILYFNNKGLLMEVKQNVQPCKTKICPTYKSALDNIKYVIEIKAMLSKKLNIKKGTQLTITNLKH